MVCSVIVSNDVSHPVKRYPFFASTSGAMARPPTSTAWFVTPMTNTPFSPMSNVTFLVSTYCARTMRPDVMFVYALFQPVKRQFGFASISGGMASLPSSTVCLRSPDAIVP